MDTDQKRRLVTVAQLHSLLEFMREHPELARGLSRGRRGKLMTVKVWNSCANKLNAMEGGAVKDGKGWSKYWCDWKYRVRRHALEIRVARDNNTLPPEGTTPMSPIEETIMAIIGDSSIDRVVVKSDPLQNEDSNEEEEQETNENDRTSRSTRENESRKRSVKRCRVSEVDTADQADIDDDDDDDDDDDPGSPPQQRARVTNAEESESEDDNTAQFLRLEKMQLENTRKIQKSMCEISLEICKLTDIMAEIRDVLVKRLDHIT